MKKILFLVSVLSVTLFANNDYKSDIDANDAYKMQQNGALLVDVRTKEEYKIAHAKGSVNIEIFSLNRQGQSVLNPNFVNEIQKIVDNNKEKELLIICRSGARSTTASNLLAENGFNDVHNVQRGFSFGWEQIGLPVSKGN